jgi:hypothetical protein
MGIYSGIKRERNKKRVTAVTQTFVNLKSNTMKNTMQRYVFFFNLQENLLKNHVYLNYFNRQH